MRILVALPGLHRFDRGAETAFISIARELVKSGDLVTLIGSGHPPTSAPYRFARAASLTRVVFESFPSVPILRNEYAYEELTFLPGLLWRYHPNEYDVTLTCSYPFTNWALRRPTSLGKRPAHVFVTQNGDWPAFATNSEYRFFSCEGLVCTNPDFYDRNRGRWRSCLIPNGVDINRFCPGVSHSREFGLRSDRFTVLMVSALVSTKRIDAGIQAVAQIPDAHLVVAGDGPLRQLLDTYAAEMLPGRYTRLTVPSERMSDLYRSADVFLHLAKEESFGNVFIEAMACGLPVVAHDTPRSRWILGNTGFLLDTDDCAAVARQIKLIDCTDLAARATRVKRAATFSWEKIGEMYRAFLNTIVATSAKT